MKTTRIQPGTPLELLEPADIQAAMRHVLAEQARAAAVHVEAFDVPADLITVQGGASARLYSGGAPLCPPAEWAWHVVRVSVLGGPVRLYAGSVAVGQYRCTLGDTHGSHAVFPPRGFRLAPGMVMYAENVESATVSVAVNIAVMAIRVTTEKLIH